MSPTENIRKAGLQFAELERKAKNLINSRQGPEADHKSLDGARDLIEQLQIYQAELEIQNEELRDAQQALLTSRNRLSYLYHQAPVGYISVDKNGFIREVNQRLLNMLGMTMDACLNKPLVNFILDSDRAIFLGRFRAFFDMPKGKHMEICLQKSDKSALYALLEGRLAEDMPDSTANDKEFMLLTISDITARRDAEANLRLADKIIHTAQEAILVTDAQGTILNVNPCFEKTTGYTKDEIIGKNPRILQSGRQNSLFYNVMWKQVLNTGCWQGIVWNRRRNGEEYAEKLTINAIYGDRKEVTHYVGVFTDITDQLELEEKLRQSQKMEAIGTLVGGIAHDFNNMLAGIVGNLYLAKKKSDKQAELIPHLEVIGTLSDKAAEMIAQMLTFARKGIVQMKPLALNHCINEILTGAGWVSIPENIRLNINLCEEDLVIKADQTQIQQLVINLLSNARDALAGQSQPAIETHLTRYCPDKFFLLEHDLANGVEFAHLTISDNGCGIDSEQYARIFEPFYTTKEAGKGTGLGLAMVYGAVQTHGGVIQVESIQGGGTSFHLYLPLIDMVLNDNRDAPLQMAAGKGEIILVADDDAVVLDVTTEILANHGYRILQADDGRNAWNLFESHFAEIDLVILDIIMPNMNGDEVAEKVRQLRPDIPIIFATGYDRQHVLSGDNELENSTVLNKPFQYDHLSHLMRTLLD